jgi:hypothetical protein
VYAAVLREDLRKGPKGLKGLKGPKGRKEE